MLFSVSVDILYIIMYVPQMMMSAWTVLVTTPVSTMKALSHVNATKDIDSKAVHRV